MRTLARALLMLASTASAGVATAAPAPGRYDGEMCVAASSDAPSCGPVQLDLDGSGHANVRVSDIVYRLHLRPNQVDVLLTQGQASLDEFSSPYAWNGKSLFFIDGDKNDRYEVRFGRRR